MNKQKKRREVKQADKQTRRGERFRSHAMNQNQLWDGCEGLYGQCAELLQSVELMQTVISAPGLIEELKNPVEFEENMALFIKDSADLSQRLKALHDTHAGRKGSAKTPDEFTQALATHEHYVEFVDLWRQSVQPTLNLLLEKTSEAEIALLRKHSDMDLAQAQAQDPNDQTPIDVEVKDVVAGAPA